MLRNQELKRRRFCKRLACMIMQSKCCMLGLVCTRFDSFIDVDVFVNDQKQLKHINSMACCSKSEFQSNLVVVVKHMGQNTNFPKEVTRIHCF